MSFSSVGRTLAVIFFALFSLLMVTAIAVVDLNIAMSAKPSEIPEHVTTRYAIVAGLCIVGVFWGMWSKWTVLRRIDKSNSLSLYRRCTSALMAGILVGGLVIATTSSSVAFLTGFLLSVQGVPASTVENAAWIVVLTLVIPILAAYIAAHRYISHSTQEFNNMKAEKIGNSAISRRDMIHATTAVVIFSIAVLVSRIKGGSQAKLTIDD